MREITHTHKQKIAALLAVTLILCDLISGSPAHLQARQKNNQTEWSEEPTPEPTVEPTAEPTEEPEPTVTPQPAETPKPVEKYELVSPHAKYYKGGMKGIHYRRVKGKKVYHLYEKVSRPILFRRNTPVFIDTCNLFILYFKRQFLFGIVKRNCRFFLFP